MRINRSKLIQHIARIATAGQFKDVVFHDGFACTAFTPQQTLAVDAPAIDGAEPLAEEIGFTNLDMLAKALRLHPGEGNTGVEVDVYVEDRRLVIDDSSRGGGKHWLVLSAPRMISTRIENETADKLFAIAKDGVEITLTKNVLEGVCNTFALYKAEELEVRLSKGRCTIFVGNETSDRGEYVLAADKSKDDYSIFFGKALVDVFSIVQDFSAAVLVVTGENRPVLIADGPYEYIVSPRTRGSEVRAVKKEGESAASEPSAAPAEEVATPRRARGKRGTAAADATAEDASSEKLSSREKAHARVSRSGRK